MLDFIADEIALLTPERLEESAWLEHTPFAFAVVKCHKPSILVELGTHSGVSYCAFCQGVSASNISCKCYAVDNWIGDEHAGFYDAEVFEELSDYHGKKYSHFSQLKKMSFDQALGDFSDESIDLLHIDGCHAYEAVKHDFESWLPKMTHRGIVLLHDTAVTERDFGVWRFFRELESQYPTFEFTHGYGLGIVGVGSLIRKEPIWELFEAGQQEALFVKGFFSILGERVALLSEVRGHTALVAAKDAQYADLARKYTAMVHSASWQVTRPFRVLWRLSKQYSSARE